MTRNKELTEREKKAIRKLDKAFTSMLATAFGASPHTIGGILAWARNPESFRKKIGPKTKSAAS